MSCSLRVSGDHRKEDYRHSTESLQSISRENQAKRLTFMFMFPLVVNLTRRTPKKYGVNLIIARPLPGFGDPLHWLIPPPRELLCPDVVVGHGRKTGGPAYLLSSIQNCKYVQMLHVFAEDLGKFKFEDCTVEDAIEDIEKKHKLELQLCAVAHLVIAIGPYLQQKYSRLLPHERVEVITPGLIEKFLTQATRPYKATPNVSRWNRFVVIMVGRGSYEDLELKGYDIVASAIASLGRKFNLIFVGSPQSKHRRLEAWFLQKTGIARAQLTIRGYRSYEDIKSMFEQSDLVTVPSRTEGFGMVGVEAISAGVPVLVSSETGIAFALEEVEGGTAVIVYSDNPEEWARRIQQVSEQKPEERFANAVHLREQYEKVYSWDIKTEKFTQWVEGMLSVHCLFTGIICWFNLKCTVE